ncbi:MAG: sigma-54-dependent Fis family transcriptional regulator [Bdellovibrionaceae bacterium]|nr:sigma-54-dependent Fis family transcriptional regulator [Pseudobdellovibrionaceae bacterium]
MQHTLLLVDDKSENLDFLRTILKPQGYNILPAENVEYGASLVKRYKGKLALALIDHNMPGKNGDEAIRLFKDIDPDLQCLTITGEPSEETIQKHMEAGSYTVLSRKLSSDTLKSVVSSYCDRFEAKTAVSKVSTLDEEKGRLIASHDFVGGSDHLVQLCQLVDRYAKTDESVLIRGENGTGKERVARAIHSHSEVADGPFVAVNCAAISEGVIESELFGHVRGSFTGAMRDRAGYFRDANGGTLFLDEIGDMPLSAQAKLLRVLQEKEIIPVGATKAIKIRTRIIAATNTKLEDAIKGGRFREDLYYRLNVMPIHIMPLRDRVDDIVPLVHSALDRWNKKTGEKKEIRARTVSALKAYSWPGNVRELEGVMARVLARTEAQFVEPEHLDDNIRFLGAETDSDFMENYKGMLERHEREHREFITSVLKRTGSLGKTAVVLDIPKPTLYSRAKLLGINNTNKKGV